MVVVGEEPKVKRPLMTSRQIGMAASVGGLCFAWRALGLLIPTPVPGMWLDVRAALYPYVSAVGGPIVSLIVHILGQAPTPVFFVSVPGLWAANGLIFAFMYKNLGIYKINRKYRWIFVFIAFAISYLVYTSWLSVSMNLVTGTPLYQHWILNMTLYYPVAVLYNGIILNVLLTVTPSEPRWRWF